MKRTSTKQQGDGRRTSDEERSHTTQKQGEAATTTTKRSGEGGRPVGVIPWDKKLVASLWPAEDAPQGCYVARAPSVGRQSGSTTARWGGPAAWGLRFDRDTPATTGYFPYQKDMLAVVSITLVGCGSASVECGGGRGRAPVDTTSYGSKALLDLSV
jgi:hypothetical protein